MTPQGYLANTAKVMKRIANAGDVDAFRAYTVSDTFIEALVKIGPKQRQSLLRQYAVYAAECEAFTRHKLAKPQRRPTSRWLDPKAQAKLVKAYAIAGNDHEKAGRLLGCTAGAARLAKKRLDAMHGLAA